MAAMPTDGSLLMYARRDADAIGARVEACIMFHETLEADPPV
jgi:hypothetical protein